MDERTLSRTKAAGRWVSAITVCVLVAPAGAVAAEHDVNVGGPGGNLTFSPPAIEINVGDTITWTNRGGSHNIRFAGEPAARAVSSTAWSYERTFPVADTFSYYCEPHQDNGMTGTVRVVTPPGTPPPPGGTSPPGDNPGSPGDNPGGSPGSPGGQPGTKKSATKITLKVSDATPRAGSRVRFYGSVTPAHDGRKVAIQKRGRGGSFKTVARATLRDAGRARSTFSRRLRVRADGVYRARFGSVLSAKRKLDVSS
jgi:plastocyanin